MKHAARAVAILFICAVVALGALSCGPSAEEAADLAVLNAKVFTVWDEMPEAQAVAVKDGVILAVGTNEEIDATIGRSTEVIDAEGRLVLPGFIDSHCHFSSGGRRLSSLSLRGARSIEEIQQRITDWINEHPDDPAVFGTGSFPNTSLFPGLGWPTKEILDEVSADIPVVIGRGGGHALWVNSKALEVSGITRETEAPYGGEVVLDEDTGEPTGVLKEAAQRLIRVDRPTSPRQDIEAALAHAAELGITGISTSAGLEELRIYRQLRQDGQLTLRVSAWLSLDGVDEYVQRRIHTGDGDEMVRIGMLKGFIDGTIGVRSALLFEDFSEEPGNSGLAQYSEEELNALVAKAHANGYQVGIHAIGDKGVHWVLNAVAAAREETGPKGLRHRVEHNTINALEDIPRFAELGVVASMQPNITGGQEYRVRRLGEERAHRVDMWRTLLDNGVVLAWGTDWPVSSIDPMFNLQQLVTRYPEQRLTMEEAIKYYTYGSAYAQHQEEVKGTLQPGMFGDMVVLSQDLLTIDPEQVPDTEVLYTILGGEIVYQR